MKRLLFLPLLFISTHATELKIPQPQYQFKGTHYTASYYGCNHDKLMRSIHLIAYFVKAIDKSGAELLRMTQYVFENGGITAAGVLSESHASIHTYPEHDAVFVDLFTCGDRCDWRPFEKALTEYLGATKIRRRVRCRK